MQITLLDVQRAILDAGRPLMNRELASRLGVTKGSASKVVTRYLKAGRLSRARAGRIVRIGLADQVNVKQ